MPNISKSFYRNNAPTSSTTLYTVPSSTTAVVTDIVLVNNAGSENNIILNFNGKPIIPTTYIPAYGMVNLSIKQVLNASETITATANSSNIVIHISGVEIS
jgi:hypothetical protein